MANYKFSRSANMIHSGKFVSATFRTRNAIDIIKLGEAFAAVVALENVPDTEQYKTIRLGLQGEENSGKSTFSDGLVNANDDLTAEKEDWRNQFTGYSPTLGNICRIDIFGKKRVGEVAKAYKSRNSRDFSKGQRYLDIIEHAENESQKFHVLAAFNKGGCKGEVEILCSKKLSKTVAYQKFLFETQHLRV